MWDGVEARPTTRINYDHSETPNSKQNMSAHIKTIHEKFDIALLVPHELNPKDHTADQIEHIATSIKTFDWTQPIVADENNKIIIGHGRWLAAKQANITHAPVWILSGYTDDEKKMMMISDNKLNMDTTWNFENLQKIMSEIDFAQISAIDLSLNFDFLHKEFSNSEISDLGEDEMILKFKLISDAYFKCVNALREIDQDPSKALCLVLNITEDNV